MSNTQEVAKLILTQLGGNQFLRLVGGKNLVALSGDGGLALQFGQGAKNKANRMRVEFDYGTDTYTVKFGKIYRNEWKTISEHEGIYCDMLQDLFTSETGFYTTL